MLFDPLTLYYDAESDYIISNTADEQISYHAIHRRSKRILCGVVPTVLQ